ncbi:MAG: SH3 domain-containing protein [Candidatus Acidiferrales bacterium]
MKSSLRPAVSFCRFLFVFALLAGFAGAQTATYERTFSSPISDVERVVRNLRPTSSGRLPTVDGFVEPGDQPLDRYDRGYYECTFQVIATPAGGATVRASSKITAWYTDPTPARSGYRVLVSNGHVENDFLDQIQGALGANSAVKPADSQPARVSPGANAGPAASGVSGGLRAPQRIDPSLLDPGESSSNKSAVVGNFANRPPPPAEPALPSVPAGESLETLKLRRAATEKRAQELAADIKNFEDILHNQVRPADLVVVKRAGTHVFSKASEESTVLFTADAQDEFQLLDSDGAWVHVQISGVSRGWIRRAHLDLPEDLAQTPAETAAPSPAPAPAAPPANLFNVGKDETTAFGGNWPPLKGKQVRVIWLEPISPSASSTAGEKLAIAKPLFEKAYRDLKSSVTAVGGVVIVFDSADGGQIAATLASLRQLTDGAISESAFWRQCSLDPPESFDSSAKP